MTDADSDKGPKTTAKRRNESTMVAKRDIDQDLIRRLASLLTETELTEIEIEQDGLRVRVVRAPTPVAPISVAAPPPTVRAEVVAPLTDARPHPGTVASPMVGTAFRAAEPGARPYVDVGDIVREGQTLLIIEAMKTMNQIPAPRAGRIVHIMIEDGQPVEYGEPLMVIE